MSAAEFPYDDEEDFSTGAQAAPRVHSSPPNPVEVERQLFSYTDLLEDASVEYVNLCSDCGRAEAAYKEAYNRALVSQIVEKSTERMKIAKAELAASEQQARWLAARELQKGKYTYIQYLHKRVEMLRTVSANYRRQG